MKESPDNIFITCADHASRPAPELHNLKPEQYVGSHVKLRFTDADGDAEHLWVEVIGHGPDGQLLGRVDNFPVLALRVKCDDEVVFAINDIEDMLTPPTQEKPRATKEA